MIRQRHLPLSLLLLSGLRSFSLTRLSTLTPYNTSPFSFLPCVHLLPLYRPPTSTRCRTGCRLLRASLGCPTPVRRQSPRFWPAGERGMGGGALSSMLTAVTISACTLLSLVLFLSLRAHEGEDGPSSSSPSSPPPSAAAVSTGDITKKKTAATKKKKVRFSQDVEDTTRSSAEYRTRLRLHRGGRLVVLLGGGERTNRGGGDEAEDLQERGRKGALADGGGIGGSKDPPIPANRRVLYQGLCQYRSQMASFMLYPT